MLEKLKEFYTQFSFLGIKEVALLLDLASIRTVKANETLVRAGDKNYNMFIVLKGMLRNHVVKSNGDERTVFLVSEGMIVGSPRTVFQDKPTNETIHALEDSWLAVYDIRKFEALADKYPKIQKMYVESLKMNMLEAVARLEVHTVLNPEERYRHYQEEHPEIVQRVPQIHLASYLGVTPVSLSRIRSRMTDSKK